MVLGKPVISLDEYCEKYRHIPIVIASGTKHTRAMIDQLRENNIENFEQYVTYNKAPLSKNVAHGKWAQYLAKTFNQKGMRVLEIGSREVTGDKFSQYFDQAEYIGFDYMEGDNVDVVGDAHYLSTYFEGKFDLIFSSAVFEHLAMPWVVAEEISQLLNIGGCVFIETHYSFNSHHRPWHFFQFSDEALKVLFSKELGFECMEAGVSNPLVAQFHPTLADEYLRELAIGEMYCHSEFLGKKVREVKGFNWKEVKVDSLLKNTHYPTNPLK